jgi:uncharacterized protein (DUF427 family)
VKAMVDGHVIADSEDIVANSGYHYFPRPAVRMEWLEKTQKTDRDLECPHGVQFYDVVIDGRRHPRAAWCYEAPQPSKAATAGRLGFWRDVKVI